MTRLFPQEVGICPEGPTNAESISETDNGVVKEGTRRVRADERVKLVATVLFSDGFKALLRESSRIQY